MRAVLVGLTALVLVVTACDGNSDDGTGNGGGTDVVLADGAGLSDTGGGTGDCAPNATQACLCLDGKSGVQQCKADRTWAACVCGGGDDDDDDPDAGSNPDRDTGSTPPRDTGGGSDKDVSCTGVPQSKAWAEACESDCECPDGFYCYDGPYMAPFRFCTKFCGGVSEGCGNEGACLQFTATPFKDWDLTTEEKWICMPRCKGLGENFCTDIDPAYTCPGSWTEVEGVTLGAPTCQVQ